MCRRERKTFGQKEFARPNLGVGQLEVVFFASQSRPVVASMARTPQDLNGARTRAGCHGNRLFFKTTMRPTLMKPEKKKKNKKNKKKKWTEKKAKSDESIKMKAAQPHTHTLTHTHTHTHTLNEEAIRTTRPAWNAIVPFRVFNEPASGEEEEEEPKKKTTTTRFRVKEKKEMVENQKKIKNR